MNEIMQNCYPTKGAEITFIGLYVLSKTENLGKTIRVLGPKLHLPAKHKNSIQGKGLTPRFPLRQICALRPFRRDCARLRYRRISWILSSRGFLS